MHVNVIGQRPKKALHQSSQGEGEGHDTREKSAATPSKRMGKAAKGYFHLQKQRHQQATVYGKETHLLDKQSLDCRPQPIPLHTAFLLHQSISILPFGPFGIFGPNAILVIFHPFSQSSSYHPS